MSEASEPNPRSAQAGEVALPEGEEHAPPGTRPAAVVRWSLVGFMAVAAVSAWVYHVATGGLIDVARARYHCPMHPTVVMEQKGECPICGMDLVPAAAGHAPHAADDRASAAAHAGGAAAAVPASAASGGDAAKAAPRALYTCPMHPAFVVEDPRARCPDCGMKLVPKDAGAAPAPPAAAGVEGLAPVELTAERIQLTGMRTAPAVREPLGSTIRTVGFVTANEKGLVSVNVRFSGWIESLGAVDVGQLVEKGEVLATVYSPDAVGAQQQFLATSRWSDARAGSAAAGTAATQYDVARDARQRLELLGIAAEDVDALAASGKPSNTVNVRAPARGYIAKKAALRGLYVQPGTEVFQIADLSTVWVVAEVYESEIGRVRVGQKAVLELAAYPGERFGGKVTFIYPALAPGSRTLQARVEFRNPGLKLRPGMYGDVTLDLGAADAVVVPADALVDTGEVQYVFVSRGGGRFEPRRVRAGGSGGGKVAILEGLAEGERVVTTANFLLDSESRLRAAIEGFGAGAEGK